MDWETEAAAARSAKMAELRQVKQIHKDFGEGVNADLQDAQTLGKWIELGGTEESFAKINGRMFAAMTEQQQAAFVRGFEVMNG